MRVSKSIPATVLGTALVLLAAEPAMAGVIFTNLSSSPPTYATGNGHGVGTCSTCGGNLVEAMPFIATSTADLADAVLALQGSVFGSSSDSALTVYLESDSGGFVSTPASILATLIQQGTIPTASGGGLVTFDYSGPAVNLSAGTEYWLVALQSDSLSADEWFDSNSDQGTIAFNHAGSATGPWTTEPGFIGALQVDGPAPVPEPSSLSVLAMGLIGLLGYRLATRRSARA